MDQICRNYAELVLKRGVNIQPGQVLVIDSPMWAADFDHLLMEEAFKLGAKDTIIHYADAEAERLRPEAEAYARVKAHIGEIECSAQKRADDLEASVMQRLNQQLAEYKRQYQELVTTFNVASDHVLGELRKVEVNLSQLPRTFDKMGGDLADLEHVLQKK